MGDDQRTGAPWLRAAGTAGTLLMAGSGYLAGAMPWSRPELLTSDAWLARGPVAHAVGIAVWFVGLVLLLAAWLAAMARIRRGGLPVRWAVTTVALWAVPLVLAPPLASHDVYAYACQGQLYTAGLDPYHAGPDALPCSWLAAVPPIWRARPAPYGPFAILVDAAAAAGSGGDLLGAVAWLRLAALLGVVLLAVFLPRLAAACGVEPAAAVWLGLANPLVLIHLVSGAHNDALMAGLLVAGLVWAARAGQVARVHAGWAVASGLAVGLATAVKVTAVFGLLFSVTLVGLYGAARWRSRALHVATAAGVFGAVTVASGLGLAWVHNLPTDSIVHWLSVPSGIGFATGWLLRLVGDADGVPDAVRVVRTVALYVLLPVTVIALWWRSRRATDTRSVVRRAGWALLVAVLFAPLVYPWYLVTPVAVLAAAGTAARLRTGLAVLCGVAALVILPDSGNLAIATRGLGGMVELALLLVAGGWWLRRRWRRRYRSEDRVTASAPNPT